MATKTRPTTTSGVTTALIYTRVSSDEQAREGLSLPAQLAECRRYAVHREWVLGDEYQDVMKGTRDDRPGYQTLLSAVRHLRADGRQVVVVVAALDRFGRRLIERVRCREELKSLGVSVHSVREGGEVSDLVSNILASVAQEEVRRLGERVSASHRHVATSGWRKVGWVAWGYQWREATSEERKTGAPAKVLTVNESEAPFVREAFQRVANGETIRGITIWIASLPDAARGGRRMSYPAVRSTLMAPVYIARPQRATAADPIGRWVPIIGDETWTRVQEQIASHTRIPRQASGRYLLTGLLRCQRCGSRMTGGASKRIPARYRCRATDVGAAASNTRCSEGVTAHKLDDAVLGQIQRVVDGVVSQDATFEAAVRKAWDALHAPELPLLDARHRTIEALRAVSNKSRERLKRAALLLVDGDIDKSDYEAVRAQAQADLDSAESEMDRLLSSVALKTAPLPSMDEVLREAGGWSNVLLDGDTLARREVIALLVERIEPIRISHGKFGAAIDWTPLGLALQAAADGAQSDAA